MDSELKAKEYITKMGETWHWVIIILVGITFLLFFATHATETDSLMQTGVKSLAGVETGFASFATTQGQGQAHS